MNRVTTLLIWDRRTGALKLIVEGVPVQVGYYQTAKVALIHFGYWPIDVQDLGPDAKLDYIEVDEPATAPDIINKQWGNLKEPVRKIEWRAMWDETVN